jgi:hypothetical protein
MIQYKYSIQITVNTNNKIQMAQAKQASKGNFAGYWCIYQ